MSKITLFQASNTSNPDVSVIIPTYNRISMLEEALDSLYAQEFDGTVEIIVVDEYLKSQIASLEGKERCFSVCGVAIWNTAKNKKGRAKQKPNLERYSSPLHHLLVEGSYICTPSSVVFPRQVFDEVGLFDEELKIAGDTDFYIRCLLADYQQVSLEMPLAIWRNHGDQLTNSKNDHLRMEGRLLRVHKYYPLIEKRVDIVSLKDIYAEIYTLFARKCCLSQRFFQWIVLSIRSTHYASLGYILFNMLRDIKILIYSYWRERQKYSNDNSLQAELEQ